MVVFLVFQVYLPLVAEVLEEIVQQQEKMVVQVEEQVEIQLTLEEQEMFP